MGPVFRLSAEIGAAGAQARDSALLQSCYPVQLLAIYRDPNLIQRYFASTKHFRRIVTRYDKLASSSLSLVHLDCTFVWLA